MTDQIPEDKARTKAIAKMDPKSQRKFNQLKLMITNGQIYTNTEALALATFASYEGLDPFIGECWLLKNAQTGKIVGPAVGIKGLRKKANESIPEGEHWFPSFKDLSAEYTKDDPDILIAFECTIRYTVAMERYLEIRKAATDAGIKYEDMKDIVGEPPSWSGIGIFRASEKNKYRDATFPPDSRAKKRAEAAAIKAWRSLNYTHMDQNGHDLLAEDTDAIEVEVIEESKMIEPEITPTQKAIAGIKAMADVMAASPADPLEEGHKGMVLGAMKEIHAPGDTDVKRHIVLKAIFGKPSSKSLTQAQWLALWDFIKPNYAATGSGLEWNKKAEKILNQIVAEQDAQQGQEELFSGEIAG